MPPADNTEHAGLAREADARALAKQFGLDGDELIAAAYAVWSNLSPQSVSYDRALSIAGVALRAAKRVKQRDHPESHAFSPGHRHNVCRDCGHHRNHPIHEEGT